MATDADDKQYPGLVTELTDDEAAVSEPLSKPPPYQKPKTCYKSSNPSIPRKRQANVSASVAIAMHKPTNRAAQLENTCELSEELKTLWCKNCEHHKPWSTFAKAKGDGNYEKCAECRPGRKAATLSGISGLKRKTVAVVGNRNTKQRKLSTKQKDAEETERLVREQKAEKTKATQLKKDKKRSVLLATQQLDDLGDYNTE